MGGCEGEHLLRHKVLKTPRPVKLLSQGVTGNIRTRTCTHTQKERVGERRGGMAAVTINVFRMTYGEKLLTGRRANEVQTSSESFNALCLFKNTTNYSSLEHAQRTHSKSFTILFLKTVIEQKVSSV